MAGGQYSGQKRSYRTYVQVSMLCIKVFVIVVQEIYEVDQYH